MAQVSRSKTETRRVLRYARALNRVWLQATEAERDLGRSWYSQARRALIRPWADSLGLSVDSFAGIVAAISPGCAWPLNVLKAVDIVRAVREGVRPAMVPTYSYANVEKAVSIAQGADPRTVLGGPKVTAFYRLLRDGGNVRDVCVDTHILDAATGRMEQIRNSQYTRVERKEITLAVHVLAGVLNRRPCTVQSAVWIAWRRMKGSAR